MKKWIFTLISLGYMSAPYASEHSSFLVSGADLQEVSYYPHILETPSFFTHVYPQNLNPNLVIVPRTNNGFMFGITGYMMRGFDNQLDYAISDPINQEAYIPSLGSSIRAVNPDYDPALGVYLGYIYPYTGRDVKLDLFAFSGSGADSIDAPPDGVLWTPLALYDRTTQALTSTAKSTASVGQAKLLFGQQIFAGNRFRFHPSFGAQYTTLTRKLNTNYLDVSNLSAEFFGNSFVAEKSKFSGLGPVVQLDGSFFFAPEFALVGHFSNAILIGGAQSYIQYTEEVSAFPEFIVAAANTGINSKTVDRAVPNFDGRIGLLYEHLFCGKNSRLTLEVGYEYNHYFNAIDTYRSAGGVFAAGGPTPVAGGVYVNTPYHVKNVHDLTLDGPYLSIGLSGIACPSDVVIDPVCVTVPKLEGGFSFGIGVNYFQVQHNQRDYALVDPTPNLLSDPNDFPYQLTVPSQGASLQSNTNDNAYGGMINLGYIFGGTPYDVQLHVEGSQASDHHNVPAAPNGTIWPILTTPFFTTYENPIQAREAISNLKFNYSEGHLDLGQSINAESLLWLRLFGGIQYAHIENDFHVTYDKLTTLPLFFPDGPGDRQPIFFPQADVVQNSNFNGFGPRVGLDIALPIGGFALTSELAAGFLISDIDASYRNSWYAGTAVDDAGVISTLIPAGALGTQLNSERQFSPFTDIKISLAYSWDFLFGRKWNVELGYKTTHYFNAANVFRHATNNAAQYIKQVDDVTLDGPFLNVSIYGFGSCQDCRPKDPYCVFVPELKGGFEFALEEFYLHPYAPNLDFGMVDPTPTFIPDIGIIFQPPLQTGSELNPSQNSSIQLIKPQSNTGYRLHGGYIFPLSANDVSINYSNYKQTGNNAANAPLGGVIWTVTNGSFGAQAPVAGTLFPVFADRAEALVDFEWQTGDVEVGRRIKFHNLMSRFFAGLAYAKITENVDIVYKDGYANNAEFTYISSDIIDQDNYFNGIGPRLGANMDLGLGCGFSLTGLIATDLLAGRIDTHYREYAASGDIAVLDPDKRTRFVPSLELKLGAGWTMAFVNCSQISFEIGYQVNHYFNVKDNLRFTDYTSPFVKQNQDISFDGPYARLQFNL